MCQRISAQVLESAWTQSQYPSEQGRKLVKGVFTVHDLNDGDDRRPENASPLTTPLSPVAFSSTKPSRMDTCISQGPNHRSGRTLNSPSRQPRSQRYHQLHNSALSSLTAGLSQTLLVGLTHPLKKRSMRILTLKSFSKPLCI